MIVIKTDSRQPTAAHRPNTAALMKITVARRWRVDPLDCVAGAPDKNQIQMKTSWRPTNQSVDVAIKAPDRPTDTDSAAATKIVISRRQVPWQVIGAEGQHSWTRQKKGGRTDFSFPERPRMGTLRTCRDVFFWFAAVLFFFLPNQHQPFQNKETHEMKTLAAWSRFRHLHPSSARPSIRIIKAIHWPWWRANCRCFCWCYCCCLSPRYRAKKMRGRHWTLNAGNPKSLSYLVRHFFYQWWVLIESSLHPSRCFFFISEPPSRNYVPITPTRSPVPHKKVERIAKRVERERESRMDR